MKEYSKSFFSLDGRKLICMCHLYLSLDSKDSVACGKSLQSLETISKIGMSLSPNTSIGYNVKFNAELSGSSKSFVETIVLYAKSKGPTLLDFGKDGWVD